MKEISYTNLPKNLASALQRVVSDNNKGMRRNGKRGFVAIPTKELAGLMETVHLLQSPKNARRLRAALSRAKRGESESTRSAALRSDPAAQL